MSVSEGVDYLFSLKLYFFLLLNMLSGFQLHSGTLAITLGDLGLI